MKKVLTFFKGKIIYLLIYVITIAVCLIPLPYYIDAPGGLINIGKRIQIDGGYSSKGTLNLAYVTEYEGTIPMLIASFFISSWDIYPKKSADIPDSYEDLLIRDRLWLKSSQADATILAYQKAGKEIKITHEKLFVLYVLEGSDTDMKVGDEIELVEGIEVHNLEEFRNVLSKKEVGEKVSFQVKHNGTVYTRKATILEIDGVKLIGILPASLRSYEATPSIKISSDGSESGPSGGLMTALAVYNALVEEDITKGYTIVGTGTIDAEGNVGEIGGVEYKLKGAAGKHADIFLVPSGENYEEAMALKKKKKYAIQIVPVSTFDEALDYLRNL